MKEFLFGDIVVIDEEYIGVVVKSWKNIKTGLRSYEIYSRISSDIVTVYGDELDRIERYRVRHKYLNEEEKEYQASN